MKLVGQEKIIFKFKHGVKLFEDLTKHANVKAQLQGVKSVLRSSLRSSGHTCWETLRRTLLLSDKSWFTGLFPPGLLLKLIIMVKMMANLKLAQLCEGNLITDFTRP